MKTILWSTTPVSVCRSTALFLLFSIFMTVDSAAAQISITLNHNTWSLISIPAVNPGKETPATVFADILPNETYGTDGNWAIFSYNAQDNAYSLLPAESPFEAGAGYWIIQLTGDDILWNLDGHTKPYPAKATSACSSVTGCIEVDTFNGSAQGSWSLQGYPQRTQQALSATRLRSANGVCAEGCTPDEADNASLIRPVLYRYVDSEYQTITGDMELIPGEGFWLARADADPPQQIDWLIPATDSTKVAFTADQGTSQRAEEVLKLVKSEGTDFLLLQGDLGYSRDAASTWERHLNEHLGLNFPVLAVVGNHENYEWPLYKSYIIDRVNRVPELLCEGNIGEKAVCSFRGIQVAQVAVGIDEVEGVKDEDGYPEFIQDTFSSSPFIWRVCSWHKNQRAMQTGGKSDATGWEVYQTCLAQGAMVATGHEHAYSRTFLMDDFATQSVVHRQSTLELNQGQSFVFVSGLGGTSPREQQRDGDWWASIYTSTQDAANGALFCDFIGVSAECYFRAIDGAEPDRFSLRTEINPSGP